ncbi:MAG: enoyl-CoA hydratase-related protein [Parvibaculales bacterium]
MTDFALPASAERIDSGAARLLAAIEQTDNGAIGHLRFNLPEKHNVVDLEGWQAIPKIIEKLATHDNMRLIVLRGIGGKAFVAGADIAQFEEVLTGPDGTDFDKATISAFDAIAACPVPTLAAIEGYCIGGGLGIATACDLRISRADGKFGIPAGRLGLAYPANATRQLSAAIGPSQAKRILFTAHPVNAEVALSIGLVHEVAATEEFDAMLDKWVHRISNNAPMSLQTSKFILDNPEAPTAEVKKRLADCLASADYTEGRTAFMQKRSPVFTGK